MMGTHGSGENSEPRAIVQRVAFDFSPALKARDGKWGGPAGPP